MTSATDTGERLGRIRALAQRCRPEGSDLDGCIPTTRTIIAALREEDVNAIGMRLEGARSEMPRADKAWLAIRRKRWVHYVAWLPQDQVAVDATGRQFGLAPVRILTRTEIEAEWDEVLELS